MLPSCLGWCDPEVGVSGRRSLHSTHQPAICQTGSCERTRLHSLSSAENQSSSHSPEHVALPIQQRDWGYTVQTYQGLCSTQTVGCIVWMNLYSFYELVRGKWRTCKLLCSSLASSTNTKSWLLLSLRFTQRRRHWSSRVRLWSRSVCSYFYVYAWLCCIVIEYL